MKCHLLRHLASLGAGLGLAAMAQASPYSSLYVFGDSLSDVGNDYQITAGLVPTGTYYTDGLTTGRFTNGRTYADRLAAGLGLGLAPSVSGGTDYAYGGARTTYVNAGLQPFGALSFNQQIGAYDSSHAHADNGGLYVLWIGANDMADAIQAVSGNPNAISTAINTAMQGIGSAIQNLSSKGATHFLIPNLPDLSLIPQVRSYGSAQISALARGVSQQFNLALVSTLEQGAFATLDIRQFDVYAAQTAITANPSAYGFDNVTTACYTGDVNGQPVPGGPVPSVCSSPGTHMYWDYEHPTDALHAEIGSLALAAAVPEPAQWALLLLGLGALGRTRRISRGALGGNLTCCNSRLPPASTKSRSSLSVVFRSLRDL